MKKYFLKYKWTDTQGNVQSEYLEFNTEKEMRKNYKELTEKNERLKSLKDVLYNPYYDIECIIHTEV